MALPTFIRSFVLFIFSIPVTFSFGQFSESIQLDEATLLVLENKLDRATQTVSASEDTRNSKLGRVILDISKKKHLDYSDYKVFFKAAKQNEAVSYLQLHDTYKRLIFAPTSSKISLDYVEILWLISSKILTDGNIDLAKDVQRDLETYVSRFKVNSRDLQKAKIYASLFDLTVMVIQRNGDEGLKKSKELLMQAVQIKDTNLMICCKYYEAEFLIVKKQLHECIQISEECYALDRHRNEKSDFYIENLSHLIDALIYREGDEEKVLELLHEMSENSTGKLRSYSLYAKLLNTSGKKRPEITKAVFTQFKVDNIVDFIDKIVSETQNQVPPNDFYYVLLESSRALADVDEPRKALGLMYDAVVLNREIYSKELANSLADHKTEKVRIAAALEKRANEAKVASEKRLSTLYIWSAVLIGCFLAIAIIALIRQRAQSRLLVVKNEEILAKNKSLEKRDQEKMLLVKEIHHRVKNNFQIVSSLLELQTKGIEDKRALELAVEGQNRVRSMALIHQKLYQNDNLQISLYDYVDELISEIYAASSSHKVAIELNIDKGIVLDLDTAIPLGLIVNELVTNAFKYGVSDDGKSNLTVSGRQFPNFYTLLVADNGPGIPETIDLDKTKSIGLHLVKRLSKQLMGSFRYETDNGAHFLITFKDTTMRLNEY